MKIKLNKILIYARPWSKDQFYNMADHISPGGKKIIISEHPSVDESGMHEYFYNFISTPNHKYSDCKLSELEIRDIILRCRLLRSVTEEQARLMIFAMFQAIDRVLVANRPDVILSVTIDSYIIHLIYICSKNYKIPFVGLIPSFVNGYFRITALGERNFSRLIRLEEILNVKKKLLNQAYKPSFLHKGHFAAKKNGIKGWVRNFLKPVWFHGKRIISNDPLNYHYFASQKIAEKYWSWYPRFYSGLKPKTRWDLMDRSSTKKLIYFPLQMSPEATIDYWSKNESWIDYENKVFSLIDEYAEFVIFIIKEHPNVLGNRTPGFYEKLLLHNACRLIDADNNSNELIDICDGVLVCTGTVGFEASLRNKRVYSDNFPFYVPELYIRPVNELKNIANLCLNIDKKSEINSNELTKYLLEGLLPGTFVNDGSWSVHNIQHRANNKIVADSINKYLKGDFFQKNYFICDCNADWIDCDKQY